MDTRCVKCKKFKSVNAFASNSRSKSGKHSWCRVCVSKARMKTYFKNPKRNQEITNKLITRNRKFIQEYLSVRKCADCPNSDIRVLQFDHIKGKKLHNISHMVHNASSLETIKKEIAKCEIRCANCHLIRHSDLRD